MNRPFIPTLLPHTFLCLIPLFFGVFFVAAPLKSQEVYTEFYKPELIQSFSEVSEELVCQCGCNFVLSVCPHVECPWGIPARRFIEERIRSGQDSASIIHGFRYGFGEEIKSFPHVQKLLAQGDSVFVKNLVEGYGPEIVARNSLVTPLLLIALFAGLGILGFSLWWKKSQKKYLP